MELKKDHIYELLRRSIMDGSLPPGHRLPPEVRLARELQVGQVTLRSALARLEREGLVQRHRSRGTFVSERNIRKVFLFIIKCVISVNCRLKLCFKLTFICFFIFDKLPFKHAVLIEKHRRY